MLTESISRLFNFLAPSQHRQSNEQGNPSDSNGHYFPRQDAHFSFQQLLFAKEEKNAFTAGAVGSLSVITRSRAMRYTPGAG